jgi:hypothetical protein
LCLNTTHSAAGGIIQHDDKHECVVGLHIEHQKRNTQAQQSPQTILKHLMMTNDGRNM